MTNKKVYAIGGGIIALALLIILLCTLLPGAIHKNKMEGMLDAMTSSAQISLRDPLFETGEELLGNKGKEILLADEDRLEVEAMLKSLFDGGCRSAGVQKMPGGTMAMSLKARTGTNEIIILYFEKEHFYYMDEENAILFEAKDMDAYRVFYQNLKSDLTA